MRVPYGKTLVAIVSVLAFVGALGLAHYLWGDRFTPERLRDWIGQYGMWAPLVFLLLYCGSALLFFPTMVLTLAAGLIWGWERGFLLVVVATNIAANLGFWIGRWLGQRAVQRLTHGKLQEIQRQIVHAGARTFFVLRLIPVVPFTPLNYAAGTTLVRWRDYFLGSFFGMLPLTFLYVYIGENFQWANPKLWLAVGLLVVVAFLPTLVKRWRSARALARQGA